MNYLKINEDNLYLDLAVKWKTTEHTNRFLYSATCYIIGLDFNLKICIFKRLRVTDFQKSQLRLYQYHDQSLFIDLWPNLKNLSRGLNPPKPGLN